MKCLKYICVWIFVLFLFQAQAQTEQEQKAFWKKVRKEIPEFKKVFKKYKKYRFEIVYTRVEHDPVQGNKYQRYYFGDHETYFYPASTVKFPIALKAFQRINHLQQKNIYVTGDCVLGATDSVFCGTGTHIYPTAYLRTSENTTPRQAAAMCGSGFEYFCKLNHLDPLTTEKLPARAIRYGSFSWNIHQMMNDMLVYSNNYWYNRLFDFAANEFPDIEKPGIDIHKRLMVCNSPDSGLVKNLQVGHPNGEDTIYFLPGEKLKYNKQRLFTGGYTVGKKYFDFNDRLVRHGRDFSYHNQIKLDVLQDHLIELIYPGFLSEGAAYEITEDQRYQLIKWMGMRPREDKIVSDSNYLKVPDDFTNFLYTGQKHDTLPENLRIINVIGQAYGFVTDCAYIADEDKKVEFFLAARIYVNRDGVLNDDKYEYETIAYPLMEKLGRVIFEQKQAGSQDSGALPWVFQIFR